MKNFIVILIILLLCACSSQTIRPDKRQYQGLVEAQMAYDAENFARAAQSYQQLYQQYGNQEFAIMAADSWLQLGEFDKSQQLIANIQIPNHALLNLLRAQLAIENSDYLNATTYINRVNTNDLTAQSRLRYLITHAKILDHNRDFFNASLNWIEASSFSEEQDFNDHIINSLLQIPEQNLQQHIFDPNISDLQMGWLEAAYISFSANPEERSQWHSRWGDHPAAVLFLQTQSYKNIAVLLPLSGRYHNIAKSIQQGMLAALYQDTSNEQQLTFFDTGSDGELFSSAWFGAIESGAEFIIGPLEKNSIEQLTQFNSSTVPVLLLNNVENQDSSYGLYQFSLSQDDEVISVANRLIAENKKRIMILAPETETGRELAIKFEQHLNEQGGQVISYEFYPEATHDYSREIKRALGLNDSQARARNLQTLLSTKLKYEAQIRPDIDAIFIIAKPKQARLIKPQLKFYHAESVPVYATSMLFSENQDRNLNKDLNGIKFSHSAFVIEPESLQEVLNFDTTDIKSSSKFFAFGYDALSMYSRLEWMQRTFNQKIQGMTGYLSVDTQGQVHRELEWGQFVNGSPQLLPSIKQPVVVDELENNATFDGDTTDQL